MVGCASVAPLAVGRAELAVEILGDAHLERLEIDVAGAHDGRGVAVIDECEQQMLERGELVTPFVGVFQRTMQTRFEAFRE